jgi:hypothetical protein
MRASILPYVYRLATAELTTCSAARTIHAKYGKKRPADAEEIVVYPFQSLVRYAWHIFPLPIMLLCHI